MATKKKTEIESTEEIKEVESTEAVEEAPKKTTKKSTSTKKKVEPEIEEVVEEVKAEEPAPAVEEAAPVIKEEPKKVEKKSELETKVPFTVQVVSGSGIYTFNRPSIEASRGKVIPKGARFTISEVCGPWGKIGQDRWIMITGAVVKI